MAMSHTRYAWMGRALFTLLAPCRSWWDRARPVGPAEVPTLPVRVDRAHHVQILRHRLLLQPHGFEGLGLAAVDLHARALAAAHRVHEPEIGLDRCPTVRSDCPLMPTHYDPFVVGVDELLRGHL